MRGALGLPWAPWALMGWIRRPLGPLGPLGTLGTLGTRAQGPGPLGPGPGTLGTRAQGPGPLVLQLLALAAKVASRSIKNEAEHYTLRVPVADLNR